jgi:hypothetical protein
LPGSEEIELRIDGGQMNDTTWREHILTAVAPVGTTSVRVRASMLDGVLNQDVDPQSFFVDAFSLTAAPGAGSAAVVPEPASAALCAIALGALGALRYRSGLRRLEGAGRE